MQKSKYSHLAMSQFAIAIGGCLTVRRGLPERPLTFATERNICAWASMQAPCLSDPPVAIGQQSEPEPCLGDVIH